MAMKMARAASRKKTLPFAFSAKHVEYIRRCAANQINVAEGAVRAGKTVDNVFAFAHELKTTPDKIHLATGSTAANAKLNIGDANGFGLEHIFRGQSRWGKYKGNDCLTIKGPDTGYRTRIVIFAGGALASSFKKIRGNSYGMWIATEINLHHDNTIKEAFNRQLAAKRRKIFWDLNPDHPHAPIYTDYIDKYSTQQQEGKLLGGYNYEHFTIWDNATVSEQRRREIISQYDPHSIWYRRDIEGKRCAAEGVIYGTFVRETLAKSNAFKISREELQERLKLPERDPRNIGFIKINVGVDFGGNGSGHALVATGLSEGYNTLFALASEWHKAKDTDATALCELFVNFVRRILAVYGRIDDVFCDSAEQTLINTLRTALNEAGLGFIRIRNAWKTEINDRIFAFDMLTQQRRFFYVATECDSLTDAICSAVWNPKSAIKNERLDDGTSDIDTMDAFEYCFERDSARLIAVTGRKGG